VGFRVYDAPLNAYDGAVHSARAHTTETSPVGLQDGADGLRERVATAAGSLYVLFRLSVAANSGLTSLEQGTTKVPTGWGSGSATNKGTGLRWEDPANPGNGVRIDEGVPNSPWPSQQVDHVVVRSGGSVLGPDGQPIVGSIASNPQSHIPLTDWLNWSEWNAP
jgi:hypothetical protein